MSKMIEVKVCELVGSALDWAVASAIGGERRSYRFASNEDAPLHDAWVFPEGNHCRACTNWSPSTDWSQVGPLIDQEIVEVASCSVGCGWYVRHRNKTCDGDQQYGETMLIATCRAIVAAKLGDVVQVPAELLEASA